MECFVAKVWRSSAHHRQKYVRIKNFAQAHPNVGKKIHSLFFTEGMSKKVGWMDNETGTKIMAHPTHIYSFQKIDQAMRPELMPKRNSF